MPKRKSFLEKLTGAVEVEPDEKLNLKEGKVKNEKKKQEEWLPEQEGQLTVDVYQTDQDIVIKSTIAGVVSEGLDISITNDMVTIKGTREKDEEVLFEAEFKDLLKSEGKQAELKAAKKEAIKRNVARKQKA